MKPVSRHFGDPREPRNARARSTYCVNDNSESDEHSCQGAIKVTAPSVGEIGDIQSWRDRKCEVCSSMFTYRGGSSDAE